MLSIKHQGLSVIKLPCQTKIQVGESTPNDMDDDRTIHVTSVRASEEMACRFLDAAARKAFTSLDIVPNRVEVVQSPAGSGKTTANISLARHLLHTEQVTKVLMIAFNRQAVLDGASKTADEDRIHWKTLDSLVFQLFKAELEGIECTDLDDVPSIARMATNIIGMPVYNSEAQEFQSRLQKACETGNPQKLFRESKQIFRAGLQGKWWCYSLLRIRAAYHETLKWQHVLAEYKVVFVDEAQDLNHPMFDLVKMLHPDKHVIYSMDSAQKLYSFMGCIDVLKHLPSQSYRLWSFYMTFRHGQRICDYVNERSLSRNQTYAAASTPDTTITLIDDDDIIDGAHTFIFSSWRNILEAADRLLNKGRLVRIDKEKRQELLAASQAFGWTKHDNALFKRVNREFVYDVCSRLQSDFQEEDEVFLTTVHSFKGLEAPVVRVSRCVTSAKAREGEIDDISNKLYVAVTRAKVALYLPKKKAKRIFL